MHAKAETHLIKTTLDTLSVGAKTYFFIFLFANFLILASCNCVVTYKDIQELDASHPYHPPGNEVQSLIAAIPADASEAVLKTRLKDIVLSLRRISRQEILLLRESTFLLSQQKNIIVALEGYYADLHRNNIGERRFVVALAGEMQSKSAFHFLKNIAWAELPQAKKVAEGITIKDREITIQMKAVQGIGFIREPGGELSAQANLELINIMLHHPEKTLRLEAIDVFMWNHRDSKEAENKLHEILPMQYWKYVGRPRFFRGQNNEQFKNRLQKWREKWGR